MRFTVLGLVLFLFAACSDAGPSCTLENEGSPCATEETTAEIEGRYWVVTTHETVGETIEYTENGVQCVRYRLHCRTTACYVGGGTRDDAIRFCRAS